MRFIIDAQLPPSLTQTLALFGQDAEHVADIGLAAASDAKIWDYAVDIGAAIVTKDADFAQRRILSDGGPAIVWIRLPNTRRQELLAWFAQRFPQIIASLAAGEVLIELV